MLSVSQKHIILEALRPYDPNYIGVFGSYARNEETSLSDIDILYDLGKKTSLFDLMDIEEILTNKLNTKVDLVSKKYLNHHLKLIVEKEIVVLFNA